MLIWCKFFLLLFFLIYIYRIRSISHQYFVDLRDFLVHQWLFCLVRWNNLFESHLSSWSSIQAEHSIGSPMRAAVLLERESLVLLWKQLGFTMISCSLAARCWFFLFAASTWCLVASCWSLLRKNMVSYFDRLISCCNQLVFFFHQLVALCELLFSHTEYLIIHCKLLNSRVSCWFQQMVLYCWLLISLSELLISLFELLISLFELLALCF